MYTQNKYRIKKNRYNNNEISITEQGIRKYKDFFLGNPHYGLISSEHEPEPEPKTVVINFFSVYKFTEPTQLAPSATTNYLLPSDYFNKSILVADENGQINDTFIYNKRTDEDYDYGLFLAYIEGTDLYFYFTYLCSKTDELTLVIQIKNKNTKLIPGERYVIRQIHLVSYDVYYKSILLFANNDDDDQTQTSTTFLSTDLTNTTEFNVVLEINQLGHPQYMFTTTI